MKNGIFKYIFIVVVLAIIGYIIYVSYFQKKDENIFTASHDQNEIDQEVADTDLQNLSIGMSNYDSINPYLTRNRQILDFSKLIFEPLVTLDENYKPEMCLATSVSESKTEAYTYVVKIDTTKKWSDGSSVVAEDVKFSFDTLKALDSLYSPIISVFDACEIENSSTVKFYVSAEVPFIEYHLIFPIMSSSNYEGEDFVNTVKVPLGTGMYKITNVESNAFTLELNKDWWDYSNHKSNRIGSIRIKMYTSAGELYNSFKLGNVNVFATTNTEVENFIGTIGYNKYNYPAREYNYISFNCDDTILKNKEVRQALSCAIDRTNIISSRFGNKAFAADYPLDNNKYLFEDNGKNGESSVDKAKTILSENGWKYQYNKWQKVLNSGTKTISLTLKVDLASPSRVSACEAIRDQLLQMGINIDIIGLSHEDYIATLESKDYQMIMTGVEQGYVPDLKTFFGTGNISNYNNDEMNSLINEAGFEKEDGKLKGIYLRMLEIYQDERPIVGIFRPMSTTISVQKLSGDVKSNTFFSFYNIHNWTMRANIS